MEYKARIIDKLLKEKLEVRGVCLIEGPKWCGKTTTGKQFSRSIFSLDDSANLKENLLLINLNPRALLKGETPRLIEEWQLSSKIRDIVRFEVDERSDVGQFILTGSSVPINKDEIFHSGVGRISRLTMRTMSLYESLDSNGNVSLKELFSDAHSINGENPLSFDDICYLICRGGWPFSLKLNKKMALSQPKKYLTELIESDLSRMTGKAIKKSMVKNSLKSMRDYKVLKLVLLKLLAT